MHVKIGTFLSCGGFEVSPRTPPSYGPAFRYDFPNISNLNTKEIPERYSARSSLLSNNPGNVRCHIMGHRRQRPSMQSYRSYRVRLSLNSFFLSPRTCAAGRNILARQWELGMPSEFLVPDVFFFTARCTLVQSAVLRSHVVSLSVCPFVF